ncbi:MAG TPA: peptide-methionine (S)-S-oxide reductase MsrA [Bryobacteraceae bacterium]|jgi:peptide-methionine (S)-S-oxide reductase
MPASETATLGGGCFWCLEAVYLEMNGVRKVESGYMGGQVENPTYEQVCTGRTGHAEVVQVTFDPEVTSYRDVLEVFFAIHDPTTLDRQGNDIGTQYRSVIFYHDDGQRSIAEELIGELKTEIPVVTIVEAAGVFYKAEDYHQDYFRNHPYQPYCTFVVAPKVKKFREKFAAQLRRGA